MLAAVGALLANAQAVLVKDADAVTIKPPTEKQIQRAKDWMAELEEKARQVAPKLLKIETPHFYVFSALDNQAADKLFVEMAEKMYTDLCKQFDADPESVWLGKCPIFAFKTHIQYVTFLQTLDFDKEQLKGLQKTGGLAWYSTDGRVGIFLSKARSAAAFNDMLVHEGTHAFMSRFLTVRNIPAWVNEGFAEHMSETLVKNSTVKARRQRTETQAMAGKGNYRLVFSENWRGGVSFDYGIAHSVVRYMVRKDSKAFGEFVKRLKQGTSEEQALKATYDTDREGLIRAWRESLKTAQK